MEVERLIEDLREVVSKSLKWPQTSEMMNDFGIDPKVVLNCPIQLDPKRTVATVAKMLVDDKTIPDGERLAGVLMQMLGAGGAKPYEVEE